MKLSAFDLNHVRALHFLLEEAHVARAAARLAITPAAASNALQRLRNELGDPLLVRVGRTFARTPLAEELIAPAREVVAAAERLLDTVVPFHPATFDGLFLLHATDRIAEVLLRAVDTLLAERAPRARLQVRTLSGPVSEDRPEQRGLFVLPFPRHPFRSEPLFAEEYVCVMRVGHPLLRGRFSLKSYASAEHVLVAPLGESDRGVVDDALAEHGLTRRVSRIVSSFPLALTLVQHSDRIVTLPASFAVARTVAAATPSQAPCAANLDFVFRKPPLTIAPIHMQLAWHPLRDADPRYIWFRGLVHDAVQSLGLKTLSVV